MVHDTVAQKNFDPVLPPLPDNIDEDFEEESVKIVRLVKNKEPLVCAFFSLPTFLGTSPPNPEDPEGTLPRVHSERQPLCQNTLSLSGNSDSQLWLSNFVQQTTCVAV